MMQILYTNLSYMTHLKPNFITWFIYT